MKSRYEATIGSSNKPADTFVMISLLHLVVSAVFFLRNCLVAVFNCPEYSQQYEKKNIDCEHNDHRVHIISKGNLNASKGHRRMHYGIDPKGLGKEGRKGQPKPYGQRVHHGIAGHVSVLNIDVFQTVRDHREGHDGDPETQEEQKWRLRGLDDPTVSV